jgi:hypothetical protein
MSEPQAEPEKPKPTASRKEPERRQAGLKLPIAGGKSKAAEEGAPVTPPQAERSRPSSPSEAAGRRRRPGRWLSSLPMPLSRNGPHNGMVTVKDIGDIALAQAARSALQMRKRSTGASGANLARSPRASPRCYGPTAQRRSMPSAGWGGIGKWRQRFFAWQAFLQPNGTRSEVLSSSNYNLR